MKTLDFDEIKQDVVNFLLETCLDTHVTGCVFENRVVFNVYVRNSTLDIDEGRLQAILAKYNLVGDDDLVHTFPVSPGGFYNQYFNIGCTAQEAIRVSMTLDPNYQKPNEDPIAVVRPL